jgi:hypothetical protein
MKLILFYFNLVFKRIYQIIQLIANSLLSFKMFLWSFALFILSSYIYLKVCIKTDKAGYKLTKDSKYCHIHNMYNEIHISKLIISMLLILFSLFTGIYVKIVTYIYHFVTSRVIYGFNLVSGCQEKLLFCCFTRSKTKTIILN